MADNTVRDDIFKIRIFCLSTPQPSLTTTGFAAGSFVSPFPMAPFDGTLEMRRLDDFNIFVGEAPSFLIVIQSVASQDIRDVHFAATMQGDSNVTLLTKSISSPVRPYETREVFVSCSNIVSAREHAIHITLTFSINGERSQQRVYKTFTPAFPTEHQKSKCEVLGRPDRLLVSWQFSNVTKRPLRLKQAVLHQRDMNRQAVDCGELQLLVPPPELLAPEETATVVALVRPRHTQRSVVMPAQVAVLISWEYCGWHVDPLQPQEKNFSCGWVALRWEDTHSAKLWGLGLGEILSQPWATVIDDNEAEAFGEVRAQAAKSASGVDRKELFVKLVNPLDRAVAISLHHVYNQGSIIPVRLTQYLLSVVQSKSSVVVRVCVGFVNYANGFSGISLYGHSNGKKVPIPLFGLPLNQMVTVSEVVNFINTLAPPKTAEKWDNCGPQVGDMSMTVERIILAIDATPQVVSQLSEGDLLFTHHPLIFKPLKNVIQSSQPGVPNIVYNIARRGATHVCAHTNLDNSSEDGGTNVTLARLVAGVKGDLQRFPENSEGPGMCVRFTVADTEFDVHPGQTERDFALWYARRLRELALSIGVDLSDTAKISDSQGNGKSRGITSDTVVAICSGSGMSFLDDVIRAGASIFITGDCSYHLVLDANRSGVTILDLGHFGTEVVYAAGMRGQLEERFPGVPVEFAKQLDPWADLQLRE